MIPAADGPVDFGKRRRWIGGSAGRLGAAEEGSEAGPSAELPVATHEARSRRLWIKSVRTTAREMVMTMLERGVGAASTKRSVSVNRLRLAACIAICGALLVSGCARRPATITGTLVGADGGCLYVREPDANGTDLYWLRHLPPDYVADADGLGRPDGSHIGMGDSVTVSGTLSSVPFDRQCVSDHTLDATAIK